MTLFLVILTFVQKSGKALCGRTQKFQKTELETMSSLQGPLLLCLKPIPGFQRCHSFHLSAPSS